MDIQEKIQLNEKKNVNSVNVDTTIKIGLDSNVDQNIEYNLQNVLDVTEVFDNERQSTTKYRIHGEFEYFSILNGLNINYNNLNDFFVDAPISAQTKNILTDLKIYLVKPSENFRFTPFSSDGSRYIKQYEVIVEPKNIDIIQAGFSKNIFNEQQYTFIINIDVDIENMFDGLGFPITELALYVEYQRQFNGDNNFEQLRYKDVSTNNKVSFKLNETLNVGDLINSGDKIFYNRNEFLQTNDVNNLLVHYLETPISGGSKILKWKYRPIIPIRLRFFENVVRRVNVNSTSYEEVSKIPSYATKMNSDYVWRNILDNGFIDPIDEIGVSFPFINQRHYVFNNIVFNIKPDLTDAYTASVFNQIKFGNNTLDSSNPNSDLDKIGNLCN